MRWGNFMNFSYKQKYCYCITKVQNSLYNLGYNKEAPKSLRISTETNAYVVHAFLVQLRANGTKIFASFVLFLF